MLSLQTKHRDEYEYKNERGTRNTGHVKEELYAHLVMNWLLVGISSAAVITTMSPTRRSVREIFLNVNGMETGWSVACRGSFILLLKASMSL